MKTINFIDLFDWEKEADRDYIDLLERQKDLEISWENYETKPQQPAKIEFNENHIRNKPFYRTLKKITQLRSHFLTKTN